MNATALQRSICAIACMPLLRQMQNRGHSIAVTQSWIEAAIRGDADPHTGRLRTHRPNDSCVHRYTRRGHDMPRRYGSWRTEICNDCAAWRTTDHHGGDRSAWRLDDVSLAVLRAEQEREEL